MTAELSFLIFDCVDPDRLAAFWSELLGREIDDGVGPYVFLKKTDPDAVGIGFQRVAEPRLGKNRVHPDVNCDDVMATARRVEDLGGYRVPGYEAGGFLVMADPEGNEFCLLPKNESGWLDADGNAHYLDEP